MLHFHYTSEPQNYGIPTNQESNDMRDKKACLGDLTSGSGNVNSVLAFWDAGCPCVGGTSKSTTEAGDRGAPGGAAGAYPLWTDPPR